MRNGYAPSPRSTVASTADSPPEPSPPTVRRIPQVVSPTVMTTARIVGYRFGGFSSPLPKSTVKSGSTLPLKFQLQNGAGQPISDSEAQSLVSPTCKITIILVKGGPVSGCP